MPKYDKALEHYVIDERHRWLVIKAQDGPLNRAERQELASYEIQIAAYANR